MGYSPLPHHNRPQGVTGVDGDDANASWESSHLEEEEDDDEPSRYHPDLQSPTGVRQTPATMRRRSTDNTTPPASLLGTSAPAAVPYSAATIRAVPPDDDASAASIDELPHVAMLTMSAGRTGNPHATLNLSTYPSAALSSSPSSGQTADKWRERGPDRAATAEGQDRTETSRARTRTLDEQRRVKSPPPHRTRNTSLMAASSGADFLASVPAAVSPPTAPSIAFIGSPIQPLEGTPYRKSVSPISSPESVASSPTAYNARRIKHLMKTLNGITSGTVIVRRTDKEPWRQMYCYIEDGTGNLMYETTGPDPHPRVLVSRLHGCGVRPDRDGDAAYLELSVPHSSTMVHIKLPTQADFDQWYASLLHWHAQGASASNGPPSAAESVSLRSASITTGRPGFPPRVSSTEQNPRDRAGSTKSIRGDQRKSSLREAPVIKIGNMIFWDTNVGYSTTPHASVSRLGQPTPMQAPPYRMQQFGSKRWRRISGQLRENGELKFHSEADNSLISVVQLSQLSRCAIQRLDASVLEYDWCLAIYPQYTSGATSVQPSFVRPIFIGLENRILHEVWFVLLRAFTIPQLYGPRASSDDALPAEGESTRAAGADPPATTSTGMFRMERSLSVRIVKADMYLAGAEARPPDAKYGGSRNTLANREPRDGYYAEVLLDGETRAKTDVQYDGLSPMWSETFDFVDLPPVLSSASVLVKHRAPEVLYAREQQESRLVHEAYGFTSDQHGGYSPMAFDSACGKVEIYLQELEAIKDVEKWWPLLNVHRQRVGQVLMHARAEESVILMGEDYRPLSELLHRFANGISLQIAQMAPGQLKRVSTCLLDIYQASGEVGGWLMSLVEEEIDGLQLETPSSRLRYNRRLASNDGGEGGGGGAGGSGSSGTGLAFDRELIVRDMNRNAALEANLLFRGNTLLTKSLDMHMGRVGHDYLVETLAERLKEINDRNPDCEVDPNKIKHPTDRDRNWNRLLLLTEGVWQAIVASRHRCPIELRIIFRHIRACAEGKYGDFYRSVKYSSVSGFMFLRFFCPAVLNPHLLGVLKGERVRVVRRARGHTTVADAMQYASNRGRRAR